MPKTRFHLVPLAAALMFAGLSAATFAQDAKKPEAAKAEPPGKIERVTQDVKQGAQQAGRKVGDAASEAGREIKQGAKETAAGAKKGWQGFKQSASDSWRSVKGFFSQLFSN